MTNKQLPASVQERIKADAENYGKRPFYKDGSPLSSAPQQWPADGDTQQDKAIATADEALQQWKGNSAGWQPMDTAPRDGSTIELAYDEDGKETCLAMWSEKPVCMLGPRNGTFPPGWATPIEADCDTNLPLSDPPLMWREWKGEKEVENG